MKEVIVVVTEYADHSGIERVDVVGSRDDADRLVKDTEMYDRTCSIWAFDEAMTVRRGARI